MSVEGRGTSNIRLASWLAFVLLFAAVAYASRWATSDEPQQRDLFYSWDFAAQGLVTVAIFMALVLGVTIGLPRREFLGLRAPPRWAGAAARMAVVFGASFVVSVVVGLFADPAEEQGLVPDVWDSSRLAPFLANSILVCLIVPAVEELTFRGVGVGLLARYGAATAVVGVGLLFALAHGLVEAFPILATFGAGLAWVRIRTRSLYPCIILHSLFNTLAVVVSVSSARGA